MKKLIRWPGCLALGVLWLGGLAAGCAAKSRPTGCLGKDDCILGELCIDGACTPGCEGDRDCPDGRFCLVAAAPHGLCAECATAGDCEAGEICLEHFCALPCDLDTDCLAGEVCESGGCRAGCRSDAGCPDGRCDPASRTCVDCLGVEDCDLGKLCIEGACVPGCKGSRDCPEGQTCLPDEPPHGVCLASTCDLAVVPAAIDFGVLDAGGSALVELVLTNQGNQDCVLEDIAISRNSSAGEFSWQSRIGPGSNLPPTNSVPLTIAYAPTDVGQDTGELSILVNDKDTGEITVALAGSAKTEELPASRLAIEIHWQQAGDDLDLHLLAPGGSMETRTDCYYANCKPPAVLDWGVVGVTRDNPQMDMDDIPGTGPENIDIDEPADGVYSVVVHDYPGSVYSAANRVTVTLYIDGLLVETLEHDMLGEDTTWSACEIDWPSGIITPL
jgi:hypothetical protein